MIVDCHTHIWSDAAQLGDGAEAYLARQSAGFQRQDGAPAEPGRGELSARPEDHAKAAECVDKTLVLGHRSIHLGAKVPNELIAGYVAAHGGRMIGIAAVDPTEPDALKIADELLDQSEFRGLTIAPAAQNFHPADSRAMEIYELAARRGAPLFIEQSTHFPSRGCMEYARPLLLDEIAREFSELTIVISSLGHPWIAECIALLGKHRRVFSDIAGLVRRPWEAYNALVLAHQFNVMDKVVFGSDFPYFTAAEAIEVLYRLHEVTQGTNLPGVPRETLRTMIERDALSVLGISQPAEATTAVATGKLEEEEVI